MSASTALPEPGVIQTGSGVAGDSLDYVQRSPLKGLRKGSLWTQSSGQREDVVLARRLQVRLRPRRWLEEARCPDS